MSNKLLLYHTHVHKNNTNPAKDSSDMNWYGISLFQIHHTTLPPPPPLPYMGRSSTSALIADRPPECFLFCSKLITLVHL